MLEVGGEQVVEGSVDAGAVVVDVFDDVAAGVVECVLDVLAANDVWVEALLFGETSGYG